MTPGWADPLFESSGRVEIRIHTLAVRGIDPKDPQWGGDLEGHVREHYESWLEMAEEIEI